MSFALSVATVLVRIVRALPRSEERHPAPVTERLLALCDVVTTTVDGRDVITLTPKAGASGIEIIYTHGGSYVHPIIRRHWDLIQAILERTGATITVPLYKLAPAGRMAEAYEFLDKVYASVSERAGTEHPIFLAGDSAGGGLALGQTIRYRDAGKRAPNGLILFSPWVELTMTNPAIAKYQPSDPMLRRDSLAASARLWTDDLETPLASQINDSLAGLPPLAIYQGGHEILLPDVEALAKKAEAAGTKVHYWFSPKAFHVWPAVGWLPESKAALDDVAAQIKANS
jgi:monoterpene epsilon-lactone hydrolase